MMKTRKKLATKPLRCPMLRHKQKMMLFQVQDR